MFAAAWLITFTTKSIIFTNGFQPQTVKKKKNTVNGLISCKQKTHTLVLQNRLPLLLLFNMCVSVCDDGTLCPLLKSMTRSHGVCSCTVRYFKSPVRRCAFWLFSVFYLLEDHSPFSLVMKHQFDEKKPSATEAS